MLEPPVAQVVLLLNALVRRRWLNGMTVPPLMAVHIAGAIKMAFV